MNSIGSYSPLMLHDDLKEIKKKDPKIVEVFQATVGGKFSALAALDESDVNEMANSIKEVLLETAEEILGRSKNKQQEWVTPEALDLCDKRRELKKIKSANNEAKDQYDACNKQVRKKMRECREEWILHQCDKIEENMKNGNSKEAYSTLKTLTKTSQNKTNVIEDKEGNLLTESSAVLQRWTEYCNELYNYQLHPDPNIIKNSHRNEQERDPPILQTEIDDAIKKLKKGKSPGIDNVPSELIKSGGEELNKKFTKLCQKVIDINEWPEDWTKSLVIPLPKKGNLKLCQNYRTISLISHPSKVLLQVLLNRLKTQAEKLLAEEQAGFRQKRSTVEQIFNLRILIEKHLQHQKDLFHNFIDFKKAFDRVWHDGLWQVLRDFNIDNDLINTIKALYDNAKSAVFMGSELGDFFKTSVGVRQGCLLSPVLFNLFLENIMIESLQNHHTTISINGRPLCNLRFADDIDLMGGSEDELQHLTDSLAERSSAYGMEISTEKSKVMINSVNDIHANIIMNGEKLEEVSQFKYLGATLTKDGTSTKEVKIRIAAATSALARLDKIIKSKNISFQTKYKLYKSLVISIFLYGCESWTLTADLEKRIKAFENKCHRKLLRISYVEHKTNDFVKTSILNKVGEQEPLLATVKRRKLMWFGHLNRHETLSTTILQGTVEGSRRRGRQKKCWLDNIKEWTGKPIPTILKATKKREKWRWISSKASCRSPQRSLRIRE